MTTIILWVDLGKLPQQLWIQLDKRILANKRAGNDPFFAIIKTHVNPVFVRSHTVRLVQSNFEILRYFHSLLARCLNAHLGRWERFWASEQPGALHLVDGDALFEHTAEGPDDGRWVSVVTAAVLLP